MTETLLRFAKSSLELCKLLVYDRSFLDDRTIKLCELLVVDQARVPQGRAGCGGRHYRARLLVQRKVPIIRFESVRHESVTSENIKLRR